MSAKNTPIKPRVGGKYNWVGQPERLVFLGRNWSGNGYWNQFAKVEYPTIVWCEVLDLDLEHFEETKPAQEMAQAGLGVPGQRVASDAPSYEVATLIRERDGWQERAKWLQHDLHLTQCDNTLLRAQLKKDVWIWQGDGTDHLESMGNRMVVAIFAKDLRTAIARATKEQP